MTSSADVSLLDYVGGQNLTWLFIVIGISIIGSLLKSMVSVLFTALLKAFGFPDWLDKTINFYRRAKSAPIPQTSLVPPILQVPTLVPVSKAKRFQVLIGTLIFLLIVGLLYYFNYLKPFATVATMVLMWVVLPLVYLIAFRANRIRTVLANCGPLDTIMAGYFITVFSMGYVLGTTALALLFIRLLAPGS